MRVLVIGDTIIDHYIFGTVDRISPESPSVILDYEKEDEILGGACNVAANIKTLSKKNSDFRVDYFGMASSRVIKLLEAFSIYFVGVSCADADILTKTRFVAQNHHLLRLDKNKKYDQELVYVADKLFRGLNLRNYDLIVISDYDKGTFTEAIAGLGFLKHIPTIIDIKKYRHWLMDYDLDACIFKCNLKEYENNKIENLLYSNMNSMVMTQGKEGYSILYPFEPSGSQETLQYPSIKLNQNVADVVGAGDVFLSAMVVNYLETKQFDVKEMCKLGNKAAGYKVKHFGTKTIFRSEIDG